MKSMEVSRFVFLLLLALGLGAVTLNCGSDDSDASVEGLAEVQFVLEDASAAAELFVPLPTGGRGAWVQLSRAEEPLNYLDDACFHMCGEPQGGFCGAPAPIMADLRHSEYGGRIELTWDGRLYDWDDAAECYRLIAAEAGSYEARFCYGHEVEPFAEGGVPFDETAASNMGSISNLECHSVVFPFPEQREVVYRIE